MKKIAFIIGILLCVLIHFSFNKTQKEKSPNFIFILTDDQGWTSVSSSMDDRYPGNKSDYDETPNIDRLGDAGMRFSTGYAPAALCTPSRRSIQFGQSPIHTGDVNFKKNYTPKNHQWLTIPLMLKSINGNYKTAHYGKWDLRADIFPEDLGYDESDGNTGNNNGDLMTDKKTKWSQLYITKDPKRTFTITSRAINFMQRQAKFGNPFYMQLSYYAPHVDIEATQKTYDHFSNKSKGEIHSHTGWAAMLKDLDTGIGQVLDMVDQLGIADNTYIFFMSDNGGVELLPPPPLKQKLAPPSAFDRKMINYPLRGGKWVLYEGGTRVPFIVKGPGIKAHSYCHVPVIGYDILPTISVLAGNKKTLPDYLDGASFTSLLHDPLNGKVKRKEADLYFHRYEKSYEHSSIVEGNYKLISFWKTNTLELYDLNKDLGEVNDLSASMPAKAKELDQKLLQYLRKENAEVLDKTLSKNKKDKKNNEEDD